MLLLVFLLRSPLETECIFGGKNNSGNGRGADSEAGSNDVCFFFPFLFWHFKSAAGNQIWKKCVKNHWTWENTLPLLHLVMSLGTPWVRYWLGLTLYQQLGHRHTHSEALIWHGTSLLEWTSGFGDAAQLCSYQQLSVDQILWETS